MERMYLLKWNIGITLKRLGSYFKQEIKVADLLYFLQETNLEKIHFSFFQFFLNDVKYLTQNT